MAPGGGTGSGRLRKHSVTIAGHRTSLTLEDAFWHRLQKIAAARGLAVGALIEQIDRDRAERDEPAGNLSSAVRVFVLEAVEPR
ncbi:aryl-sulfate sulfotransferase [Hypericibacter adhaerens]|uniref:Aryl-sulfate sulfotransferase n=1 Tax=Hypericibacter adhaerens TaxID=2602016 RepID=A0A5J6MUE4_9PROT|nr:ribbon-helix-helix domain-containing protein [Hypericibacter adhaerens]QEX21278.1 aryl-sulfate sulfotransferase [Hypericibacter adhaerens]